MAKINKESIKQNIGNPLSVIYNKLEKNGHVSFSDIQDEYVHIHNFIENLDDDAGAPIRVSIDGVEYAPAGE